MGVHKGIFSIFLLLLAWLAGKFLLPFLFPFLLGWVLALASEPAVSFGMGRLGLKRGLAAGMGVTATLLLLLTLAVLLGALAVKELGSMASSIPQTLAQSAQSAEVWLITLSAKAPAPVDSMLTDSVERFFQNTDRLTDKAVEQVPGILSGVLGWVPGKAMALGTGVLSAYFLSARLPKLKESLHSKLPPVYFDTWLPKLRHLRSALGKWLIAQGKLMAITYGIVTLGFLLLGIAYAPGWALLVAAVDAVPLLGTGTVLVPWALVRLLQGDPFQGFGMLGLYLVAMVTRTVLEPKFFGKHLGLDPLIMLVFLYFGYRLWGFGGIVISPILAATTKVLTEPIDNE